MPNAKSNNINIWYEAFGQPNNPTLLLIMGGCCQGIMWPTEFCEKLAAAGFFVIRYDHRDTGFSTCFNYAEHSYNLFDMMLDALGLLNTLNVNKFHVVGLSMGGPIAELLAVHCPERTLSITLIATSTNFRPMNLAYAGMDPEPNSLSSPLPIYLNWIKKFVLTPPKNELENLEFRVEGWRILNGNKIPFAEKRNREMHQEFLNRVRYPKSITNHVSVCKISEEIVKFLPSQIRVPTVIFHGTEDPIFPPDHGAALAALIPHAKYFLVDGFGHMVNEYFYDLLITNIRSLRDSELHLTLPERCF